MEKIREIAEVNEFLYYKLREEGLTHRLDEDIGIEFLNLDRILQRTQTIDSMSKHSTPTQTQRRSANSNSVVQNETEDANFEPSSTPSDSRLFQRVRDDFIRSSGEYDRDLVLNKTDQNSALLESFKT